MTSTIFARGRMAAGVATLLAIGSGLRYPGGTFRDHATPGYSLTHNFLSDLGMTVAHSGEPNRLGGLLFVLSLTILVVGMGGCLFGFVRIHSKVPASRPWTIGAAVVGALVCAAFVGVALTPENGPLALHIAFTRFAFRAFPLVALLMAVATWRDPGVPRQVPVVWMSFTVALAAYVGVLDFGPRVSAPGGLVTQVVAQKLVTIVAVLTIVYQSYQADASRAPAAMPVEVLTR
jgi:hypothetical membrane protein